MYSNKTYNKNTVLQPVLERKTRMLHT